MADASRSDSLEGRWEGTWKSDDSGHNDRLRCIVVHGTNGDYRARFHANYRKIFTFNYAVPLTVKQVGDSYEFAGRANLGWYAGGVYEYAGNASATNYFSTYRCKADHGVFQMHRP